MLWEPEAVQIWTAVPLSWLAGYWALAVGLAFWLERPGGQGKGED